MNKRGISMKVHEDFRVLIEELQTERIKKEIDKISNKISYCKITKAMTNLIKANSKLKNMLVEVEIK